jgi:hypothetical protein
MKLKPLLVAINLPVILFAIYWVIKSSPIIFHPIHIPSYWWFNQLGFLALIVLATITAHTLIALFVKKLFLKSRALTLKEAIICYSLGFALIASNNFYVYSKAMRPVQLVDEAHYYCQVSKQREICSEKRKELFQAFH